MPEQNTTLGEDQQQQASHALPDDMIDLPSDFKRWPVLHEFLGDCRDSLVALYLQSDRMALHEGHIHKCWVVGAAFFATSAVCLAIIQMAHIGPWWVVLLETGAVVAAALSFWKGNRSRQNWLTERHKAEFCRMLKFTSIIRPGPWTLAEFPPDDRQPELSSQIEDLRRRSYPLLRKWLDDDNVPRPPSRIIPHNLKKLTELRDYYRERRLMTQTNYFKTQSKRNVRGDEWWRKVPLWLFISSVLIAGVHGLSELIVRGVKWKTGDTSPHWTEVLLYILIGAAALLPVAGSGIHTWRSANEGTRNISRFRAKHLALSNIEHRMNGGEITTTAEAEAVLRDLWCAEQIMESEHREWLRLMIDAEWV